MKIYTRTGDQGMTALQGGQRVAKSSQRIVVLGTLDELNASLGVVRAAHLPAEMETIVIRIQNQLFQLGAELANGALGRSQVEPIGSPEVSFLEVTIDNVQDRLPPLKAFILPGGTTAAAQMHLARSVCRRAERELVLLAEQTSIRPTILEYVNRIGDLLFVLARLVNWEADRPETEWEKPR
jgi:cob(I)alamin adenosyltransferase